MTLRLRASPFPAIPNPISHFPLLHSRALNVAGNARRSCHHAADTQRAGLVRVRPAVTTLSEGRRGVAQTQRTTTQCQRLHGCK